jgi:hypothetical protein
MGAVWMTQSCASENGRRPHTPVPTVAMASSSARDESPVNASPTRPAAASSSEPESGATATQCGPSWTPRDDAIKYPDGDFTPPPTSVEGTVFTDCAYGQTGYGEDPAHDAKEFFDVLVLDTPISVLCTVTDGNPCEKNVRMLQIAPEVTLERPPANENQVTGRRVRLTVSSYSPRITGHHHTRVHLFYCIAEDIGRSPLRSLRSVWPRVAADFEGVSCSGYPK